MNFSSKFDMQQPVIHITAVLEYYSQVYKPKPSLKDRFSRMRELFTDQKDGASKRECLCT